MKLNCTELVNLHGGNGYATTYFKGIGIKRYIQKKNVFKPDRSLLGDYMAKFLFGHKSLYENKTVLDMGCGSGLLGIICALGGAKMTYFTDINPDAVKNTELNLKKLGINNSSIKLGNLFESQSGTTFDLIIFNSPTISGTPQNFLEQSIICDDEMIKNFFLSAHRFLTSNGIILMPYSNIHKRDPRVVAKELGFKDKTIHSDVIDGNPVKIIMLY